MHEARRAGAFTSGLLLYCAAIGCASVMAGIHLPRPLALMLGGVNSTGAMLSEALLVALVLFLVALPWAYLSVKPRGKGRHLLTGWFTCGIGLAWLGWLVVGVCNFAFDSHTYPIPLSQLLLSSDTPPLWGLLNIFAVLLAAVVAARLVRRFSPPPPPRGRKSPMTAPSAQTA